MHLKALNYFTCYRNQFLAGLIVFFGLSVFPLSAFDTETPGHEVLSAADPHWFWVGGLGGQIALWDADKSVYLGTISNGVGLMKLQFPEKYQRIYSAETHYSRGSYGERTDVIVIYDSHTLKPINEIKLPSKTYDGMSLEQVTGLSGNERFMLVFNMTPAQSVSVADVKKLKFVEEISTSGCALIYPTKRQSFHSLCAGGGLLHVELNNDGSLKNKKLFEGFFDVSKDPVMEKAARLQDTWFYTSFKGMLYSVDFSTSTPVFLPVWSLVSDEEREEQWKPGGIWPVTLHEKSNKLYVLMHQGDIDTHKDAGKEVWVFDLDKKTKIQTIHLNTPATSIKVTQDNSPILLASSEETLAIEVYDLNSDKLLRTLNNIGTMVVNLMQTMR